MGFYQDQVVPRITNVTLKSRELARIRQRVTAGLAGEVLEVGFGSGLNVPYYPREVKRVRAVDPATVGRKLAARRLAASPVPVEFAGLDGQALPAESDSVDYVLVTWTMCTIPDVETALREMYRVLRRGGELRFAEHGRSPDPGVARWQDRLTPLQRRMCAGCHLNRPIVALVRQAGFGLTRLENYYLPGPKSYGYISEGVAGKA